MYRTVISSIISFDFNINKRIINGNHYTMNDITSF